MSSRQNRRGPRALAGLAVVVAFGSGTGRVALAQDTAAPAKPENITDRKIDDLMSDLVSGDDVRRQIAEAELPRRGKDAVSPLVACLQAADRGPVARCTAARILRQLLVPKGSEAVDPDATNAILAVFKNPKDEPAVRGEAARTLGDLKVKAAIPDLIEALNDNWFKVSENSRDALVRLGKDSVDPVIAAFQREVSSRDPKDGVLYRSLLILGDIGGDKARGVLADAIKAKAGPRAVALRAHAARGLGMTGDRQGIQPLIDAYEIERDFDVAQSIVRSLEWLTGQQDIIAQPLRWKAWWEAHRDEILGNEDHRYDGLLIPRGGIKKGDPLQAPGLPPGEATPPAKDAPATPNK